MGGVLISYDVVMKAQVMHAGQQSQRNIPTHGDTSLTAIQQLSDLHEAIAVAID